MSDALERWNQMSAAEAEAEILACCGSSAWAREMASRRPIEGVAELLAASDQTWSNLAEIDWMEAFQSHPRIGESRAEQNAEMRASAWSAQEQRSVAAADNGIKAALADANGEYEARFGHIFIVYAMGKGAGEILGILRRRLQNDAATERREAAEQQRQITQLRLKRWIAG